MRRCLHLAAFAAAALGSGCSGDDFTHDPHTPTGTVTLGGMEFAIDDLDFRGEDLEWGGSVMSYRELSISSGGESLSLTASWDGDLGPGGSIDVPALRSKKLAVNMVDFEGDFCSVATIDGVQRLVVGGSVTLTRVSNPRQREEREYGSLCTTMKWDVEGTIELHVAVDPELLDGFDPREAELFDKDTFQGKLRGVATTDSWIESGND